MRKRLLILALLLSLLATGAGTALAGGARNATFVKFLQAGYIPKDDPYYCEGYYMETRNGIVHGWRENPECVPYEPFINESSVHMVFKPVSRFQEADCDEENYIIDVGPWTLSEGYTDLDGDDADLRDIFGQDGERYYWVCFYHWTTD